MRGIGQFARKLEKLLGMVPNLALNLPLFFQALAAYTLPIQYLQTNEIIDTILFVLNQPRNCAINSVLIEPIKGPL